MTEPFFPHREGKRGFWLRAVCAAVMIVLLWLLVD
jgi:hypothetical protein